MTVFDKAWWLEHGSTYKDEFDFNKPTYHAQEEMLMTLLGQMKFDTVIEVGCGFGRITRLVYDAFKPTIYAATDVSQDALTVAREYLGSRPIDFEQFDLDDGYSHAPYDLVIAAEVLMHRTPYQVMEDAATLAKMGNQYIITIDWFDPKFKGESPGCYQHNYQELFQSFGSTLAIDIPGVAQVIWVTTLRKYLHA